MLTTKDIKTKEVKDERVKILTSGKVKSKEFNPKGKPKPRNKTMITTSNIEEFQKKRKKK